MLVEVDGHPRGKKGQDTVSHEMPEGVVVVLEVVYVDDREGDPLSHPPRVVLLQCPGVVQPRELVVVRVACQPLARLRPPHVLVVLNAT